jgi:hypothetical protein
MSIKATQHYGEQVCRALRWLKGVSLTLLLLAGLLVVIGLKEAKSDAVERRLTLGLAGWPPDTPPLTIALLSDIHLGNRAMDAERLGWIVSEVNAARPDLVWPETSWLDTTLLVHPSEPLVCKHRCLA